MVDTTNVSLKSLQSLSGHKDRVWSVVWFVNSLRMTYEYNLGTQLENSSQVAVVIKQLKYGVKDKTVRMNAKYF